MKDEFQQLRKLSILIGLCDKARPCKSLWVPGISQSVSKQKLENEFLKFGKIQEFRFFKDHNTAFFFILLPVCRARCVLVGDELASDIPDGKMIHANWIGLLSKHYEDATGFDIVCLCLSDSFAP